MTRTGATIAAILAIAALYAEAEGHMQPRTVFGLKPVLGNATAGLQMFTNPQVALGFVTNMGIAYTLVQTMWILLHLLFWNYSDTRPAEMLTLSNFRALLANTNNAVFTVFYILGVSVTALIVFLIPPVILNTFPTLLTRKKRRRRQAEEESYFQPRFTPTFTETDIRLAFRTILCPLCVSRIVFFNTLLFLSTLILFNVTPLLRAQGISLGISRRKKRRIDVAASNDLFERDDRVLEQVDLAHRTLARAEDKFSQMQGLSSYSLPEEY